MGPQGPVAVHRDQQKMSQFQPSVALSAFADALLRAGGGALERPLLVYLASAAARVGPGRRRRAAARSPLATWPGGLIGGNRRV